MKKLGYWGKHDVCVRCGQYIYNISIWLDPNRSNKTERPKEELPQAYLDILEKREWSVCDYTDDGRVELEWYSPAGEDFIVCVKVENFPDEILDYSDSFDPDEHIAMWIEAKQNGTKGVPGARQIVHDAEEIEKELDELANLNRQKFFEDENLVAYTMGDRAYIKFVMKPRQQLIVALKSRKWWWNSNEEAWSTYLDKLDKEWVQSISTRYADYV